MTFSPRFEHLIFDLDDTLLDTYRQLIPMASRESCQAMVDAGLNTDLEQCLKIRDEFVKTPMRYDLYNQIVAHFGVRANVSRDIVASRGYSAFHNREVSTDISLFPGAREMLTSLKSKYRLHLLTAGHRQTQEKKISILDIETFFDSIHHVDPAKGERKLNGFERILALTGSSLERHLSIGNRLDTDIGEAKHLGWKTCWVRYGEYAHLKPSNEFEIPDFEINNINELVKVCQL